MQVKMRINLPYRSYEQAKGQIANLEAIDFFFAKQFTELLINPDQHGQNQSGLLFHLLLALSVSLRDGHTCLPLSVVAKQRFGFSCDGNNIIVHQGFLFPDEQELIDLIASLAISPEDEQGVVVHNEKLYLRRYYLFEQQVLSFLQDVVDEHQQLSNDEQSNIKELVSRLFPQSTQTIDWQKVAVANALNKRFSIIAGGPGTGKTYTVTKLLAALVMLKHSKALNMALVAPTGKAAQRLSESIIAAIEGFKGDIDDEVLAKIPSKTQTIHRLLGVIPNQPNFRHNQNNPLAIDVLLIDEVSMVDLPLMARLLSALPKSCTVIMLGDAQQLPSVAAGSVLADLTPHDEARFSKDNKRFLELALDQKLPIKASTQAVDFLTYLTESRRFDGEGGIGRLAQAVIQGQCQESWSLLQQAKQGKVPQLMWQPSHNDWLTPLVEQYYRPLFSMSSVEQAFYALTKFRILSPTRLGEHGVVALNQRVEQQLMADGVVSQNNSLLQSKQALYHGLPIMISENDYSLGLYNGDIGLIWRNEADHLMAVFEQQQGGYLSILPSRLPQYETVYAMTIHKTQGSEFKHVAIIMPDDAENQLLTRELLYTGITRAKKQLTIQCQQAVWFQGVEQQVLRHSGIQLNENNYTK